MTNLPPSDEVPVGPASEAEACRAFRRCFNSGRFYEAHEVLEVLWLPVRRTTRGELWKGLIQFAAALVHVQHGRRGPALSLLRTARSRLSAFRSPSCAWIDLPGAIALADTWERRIEGTAEADLAALLDRDPPELWPSADGRVGD